MRTSIDLPVELYHRLRESAARHGITLNELVLDCLTRGVEEPPLPRPKHVEFDGVAVVPGLSNEQAVKLFGHEAASVYLAARQRIREKGYPETG